MELDSFAPEQMVQCLWQQRRDRLLQLKKGKKCRRRDNLLRKRTFFFCVSSRSCLGCGMRHQPTTVFCSKFCSKGNLQLCDPVSRALEVAIFPGLHHVSQMHQGWLRVATARHAKQGSGGLHFNQGGVLIDTSTI